MLLEKVLAAVFAALTAGCAVRAGLAGIGTWEGVVAAEGAGVFGVLGGQVLYHWWLAVRQQRRHEGEMARRQAEFDRVYDWLGMD